MNLISTLIKIVHYFLIKIVHCFLYKQFLRFCIKIFSVQYYLRNCSFSFLHKWGVSWAVTGVFLLIPVNMAESLFMMCVVRCAMIMSVDADRTFI